MSENTHPALPYPPQAYKIWASAVLFSCQRFWHAEEDSFASHSESGWWSPELYILNFLICKYNAKNRQARGKCSLIVKWLEAFSGPDLVSEGSVVGTWNKRPSVMPGSMCVSSTSQTRLMSSLITQLSSWWSPGWNLWYLLSRSPDSDTESSKEPTFGRVLPDVWVKPASSQAAVAVHL